MPATFHASSEDAQTVGRLDAATVAVATPAEAVVVLYTNYRGETALRRIVPNRIWFGHTDWHPEDGWLLDAFDLEKGAERSFAMKDIRVWLPEIT